MDDTDEPDLRPDFLLKRIDFNQWDILETKLPDATVMVGGTSRRHLSSAVQSAIAQVREYAKFFRDHSNVKWFREKYKMQVSNPNLYVLVGRDSSFHSRKEKMRFKESEGVKVFTYDDLHRIAKHQRIVS